ncbi:MAG: hypothetical protein ABJG15_17535 [Hyphomonadaceae bacterium]
MTYFKPALILLSLGAVGAMGSTVLAQTATEPAAETAQETDPTTKRAQTTPTEKFAIIDLDGNGLVSEGEFVAYASEAHDASAEDAAAKFAQIAGDDGVISQDEFVAVHASHDKKPAAKGS